VKIGADGEQATNILHNCAHISVKFAPPPSKTKIKCIW